MSGSPRANGSPGSASPATAATPGIADLTTIDGPKMLKTLHTYPLLFRRASLIRGGVETRATAVEPRRGDFVHPTR